MEEAHKKYILIAVGVIVLLLIVYFLFFRKGEEPKPKPKSDENLKKAAKIFSSEEYFVDPPTPAPTLSTVEINKNVMDIVLNGITEDKLSIKSICTNILGKEPRMCKQMTDASDRSKTFVNSLYMIAQCVPKCIEEKRTEDLAGLLLLFIKGGFAYQPGMLKLKYDSHKKVLNIEQNKRLMNSALQNDEWDTYNVSDIVIRTPDKLMFYTELPIYPYTSEQKTFINSVNPVIDAMIQSCQDAYKKDTEILNRMESYKMNKSTDIPIQALVDSMIISLGSFHKSVFTAPTDQLSQSKQQFETMFKCE